MHLMACPHNHSTCDTGRAQPQLQFVRCVCLLCAEWSDVAHEYIRGLGINADDFKHKLYVVPPGDVCSWGGMGYVGCTKDCRVWVSGDLWQVSSLTLTGS